MLKDWTAKVEDAVIRPLEEIAVITIFFFILEHPYHLMHRMLHIRLKERKLLYAKYIAFCVKASMVQDGDTEEMISKQLHEEEIERLKLEIQQCKEFIQTQQQLLQVS